MIFRRSLVRELTATAVALFLVLLAILFTILVLRLLARAAGGAVAPDGILALIGFNALFYFNILLSVALFLTVLLTLSRWYRDSEMIVWFTSGQSLIACLQPILLFAAPFLVAIVALSLFLSPWAELRKIEFERQLAANPLWDRRSARLHVTDAAAGSIEVRLAMSARGPGDLFELRCAVREGMLAWVREHQPLAIARQRSDHPA